MAEIVFPGLLTQVPILLAIWVVRVKRKERLKGAEGSE